MTLAPDLRWVALSLWLALQPATAAEFDLQGHRGARGLAPENTLVGFNHALSIGVTTLETDLAVTRDGVVVISHDPYLNADLTRNARGEWLTGQGPAIHSLTLAMLQAYEFGRTNPASKYAAQFPEQVPVDGQRLPTLAQVLALGTAPRTSVRFNIETKITPDGGGTVDPSTFARLTLDAIRAAGMTERTTVQSFDWRTLLEMRKLAPELATACLTIESPNFDTVLRSATTPSPWQGGLDLRRHGNSVPRLVKAAGCGTWSMFWRNLTPVEFTEARVLGLKIVPWTVNDPVEMARLIDMGVDGIITDYPDRLRAVMQARSMPLPRSVSIR